MVLSTVGSSSHSRSARVGTLRSRSKILSIGPGQDSFPAFPTIRQKNIGQIKTEMVFFIRMIDQTYVTCVVDKLIPSKCVNESARVEIRQNWLELGHGLLECAVGLSHKLRARLWNCQEGEVKSCMV